MFTLTTFLLLSMGSTLTKYDDYGERELSAYERYTSHSSDIKVLK